MRTPARLREPRLLLAQLAVLAPGTGDSWDFSRGAADALRWLVRGGPGPLTGAPEGLPVSLQAVVGELAAAESLLHGRPSTRRRYAQGLEHALMWAQFATAAPPAGRTPATREPQASRPHTGD